MPTVIEILEDTGIAPYQRLRQTADLIDGSVLRYWSIDMARDVKSHYVSMMSDSEAESFLLIAEGEAAYPGSVPLKQFKILRRQCGPRAPAIRATLRDVPQTAG
jgi:hypothetical protein